MKRKKWPQSSSDLQGPSKKYKKTRCGCHAHIKRKRTGGRSRVQGRTSLGYDRNWLPLNSHATPAVDPTCRIVSEMMRGPCYVAGMQCSRGNFPARKRRPVTIDAKAKGQGPEDFRETKVQTCYRMYMA
mmetsp:Transcript_4895/g.31353  ORF Transcript_4895/g.31353 Transcript_4895/m.31353 type:complete len:129 (-) Transcript_4895:1609-1995(-)